MRWIFALLVTFAVVCGCSDKPTFRAGPGGTTGELRARAQRLLEDKGYANVRLMEEPIFSFDQQIMGFAVGTNDIHDAKRVYVVVTCKNGRCRLASEAEAEVREKEIQKRTTHRTQP